VAAVRRSVEAFVVITVQDTMCQPGPGFFAEEIEHMLLHPGVYDGIVIGQSHERWGQVVVAPVRGASGTDLTSELL
jgi:hypothetical protein